MLEASELAGYINMYMMQQPRAFCTRNPHSEDSRRDGDGIHLFLVI